MYFSFVLGAVLIIFISFTLPKMLLFRGVQIFEKFEYYKILYF